MRERSAWWPFFILLFMGQLLVPLLCSPATLQARVHQELAHAEAMVGPTRAAVWLRVFMLDAALLQQVVAMPADTPPSLHPVAGSFFQRVQRYASSVQLQVQVLLFRMGTVLAWVLLLSPVLACAGYDGLVQRRVKLDSFGFQNPTAFAWGQRGVAVLAACPLVYAAMPMDLSPLCVPGAVLACIVPLGLTLRHMQPVFTA
ncbi:MAG: hypothetical protein RLZZ618_3658 [Pseudomonadota bacterium]|jgi:hypothetical protein